MKFFRIKGRWCVRVFAVSRVRVAGCAYRLFSQGSAGRILGSVTDQSGGVIAGASVTVTDVQRGVTRTLTTDQAGEYLAPDLASWHLHRSWREPPALRPSSAHSLQLEVKQDIRVDLVLQPGDQTQTVTVTEEAPAGRDDERHAGRNSEQRDDQ